MAATTKTTYASSANFTITLASLASSATAGRESTAIDNTTDLYIDAFVQVKVALTSGTPANDKKVYVYVYGSEDGTTYTDNATGSDAAITLRVPPNARLLGVIECPDVSSPTTYESQPWLVSQAFGGLIPRKWGIIVRNYTNLTLSASTSDYSAKYTGITYTTTTS
jgi:hypothetical protein